MIYLVTGMHKSGTTLVARTLHESSIPMIRGERGGGGYDQDQKFERRRCRRLNMEMLELPATHSSLTVPRSTSVSGETERELVDLLEELDAAHATWGAKDPRFCLTYPDWRPHLGPHRIVAVYRHPAQVWGHYRRNTGKPWALPLLGVLALRAWVLHNVRLLEITETSDALLVEYDRLMTTDEELGRLGNFVGTEVRDVREPDLYRSRNRSSPWVTAAEPLYDAVYPAGPLGLYERLEARRAEQIG